MTSLKRNLLKIRFHGKIEFGEAEPCVIHIIIWFVYLPHLTNVYVQTEAVVYSFVGNSMLPHIGEIPSRRGK